MQPSGDGWQDHNKSLSDGKRGRRSRRIVIQSLCQDSALRVELKAEAETDVTPRWCLLRIRRFPATKSNHSWLSLFRMSNIVF